MKQTIQLSQFVDAFRNMGRAEQFSYDALTCLFDYLTELEADLGEELELDVIGICCEFCEDTPAEIARAYDYDVEGLDDDEALNRVVDCLNYDGAYIGDNGETIVYRNF